MPRANRVCRNCGKAYYVCTTCEKSNSYKNVCCSFDCFRELVTRGGEAQPIKINKGTVTMQGELYNGQVLNILGYDLENNKFDCDDNITHTGYEFKNFILDLRELKAIAFDRDKDPTA